MRIGMILDGLFPPDPRVENEAVSLINEGHEVHLFCLSYVKNFKQSEIINGIHIHRFYCNKITYKLSALAYTFPFYHLLLRSKINHFITTNAIQIIHIHDIQVARAVFWANKQLQLPTVLDLHENRPEIMKFYAHVNSFSGKLLIYPSLWKKFEFKAINKANHLIVVTNPAKEYYLKHTNKSENEISVVPNTIRKEFYSTFTIKNELVKRYKDNYVILYLGDTGIRRGTLDIIESIPFIKTKIKNIKLVIVGKSADDNLLKNKINALQLNEYVDLEGWQPFNTFQTYISLAKIGLSPLHRNLHHDTTFANKVFQYLSFGVPVVLSDSTAQKEIIETYNCGIVHPQKNPKAIAQAVLELYNNNELYAEQSQNAKNLIKTKYNWESTVSDLIAFYKKISS